MGVAAMTLSGGEYAIHGTNVPGSIGGFVSYGCIRMYNQDISDLFDRVAVGTPVVVTRVILLIPLSRRCVQRLNRHRAPRPRGGRPHRRDHSRRATSAADTLGVSRGRDFGNDAAGIFVRADIVDRHPPSQQRRAKRGGAFGAPELLARSAPAFPAHRCCAAGPAS